MTSARLRNNINFKSYKLASPLNLDTLCHNYTCIPLIRGIQSKAMTARVAMATSLYVTTGAHRGFFLGGGYTTKE